MRIPPKFTKVIAQGLLVLGLAALFADLAQAGELFPPTRANGTGICNLNDQVLVWDSTGGKNKCVSKSSFITAQARCPVGQFVTKVENSVLTCSAPKFPRVTCQDKEFLTGINADGTPICSLPPATLCPAASGRCVGGGQFDMIAQNNVVCWHTNPRTGDCTCPSDCTTLEGAHWKPSNHTSAAVFFCIP